MFLKFFDWKSINFSGAQAWFSADRTLLISQVLGRKSRTFGEINHENHDCPSKTRLELISRIKISWTILRTKFSSLGNSRWHKTRKFMIHSYLNYFLVHSHIILINSFRFGFFHFLLKNGSELSEQMYEERPVPFLVGKSTWKNWEIGKLLIDRLA